MKICSECKLEKELQYFSKKNDTSDGYQNICKECKSIYLKEHYKENKQYYKNKSSISNKKSRVRNLQYIIDFLKINPCIDCGETDPILLDFDHVCNKKYNVSAMQTMKLEKVKEEISKCEIRCVSCHRRKTAIQLEWYKDIAF